MNLIVITASFVAEPLDEPLRLILEEAGIAEQISFAPYNQVFQELLGQTSTFGLNAAGINVLLIRLEDFFRTRLESDNVSSEIENLGGEIVGALRSFSAGMRGSLLLALLPPSPLVPTELSQAISKTETALIASVVGLPGIHVIDANWIREVAETEGFDAVRDNLAHVPFTDEYYSAMALAIGRRIHAIKVPAAKVLVLDCDNTLWRGVIGEDGVEGITISASFVAMQNFAVAQQANGILVCLASKNTEADVVRVFETRPDMTLKLSHIVAHRINWLTKPANIQSLANELNLGLDAFVFIDDNPIECAQVRAALPQVVTIQLPEEARIPSMLKNLWMFDKLVTTSEDRNRTQMYRENAARRTFESSVQNIEQFMQALALQIDIAAPSDDEWSRVEQLTQRTNQFNFTTRRRSAAELKSLVADGASVLCVKVSDRFGDYGLVGVMVAHRDGDALSADTLLLSCRVLGRGVEHAMMRRLGEMAAQFNLSTVNLPYVPTARNEPARAFADSVAAEFAVAAPDGKLYRIPTERVLVIKHRAGHDPAEVIEARLADERKSSGSRISQGDPALQSRSLRFERLALSFVTGNALADEVRRRFHRPRALQVVAAPAENAAHAQMMEIWERSLKIAGIGIDDDYFALGGTSLLSVGLFAEIRRTFAVELRLTSILEAPTIRLLSQAVASFTGDGQRGLVCLRSGEVRNVFLVHDGLGETLLYLNLAQRMAPGVAVYGIEPKRLPGIPLAHVSIEEMARYYVTLIRRLQPVGPYEIGGMCAGGVIAYAMAAHLVQQGEQVRSVVILDGATPQALKRKGRLTTARISRLKSLISATGDNRAVVAKYSAIILGLMRKTWSGGTYEFKTLMSRLSTKMRFLVFKHAVKRQSPWPRSIPQLSVMQIYNELETRYIPPRLREVPVVLIRASIGDAEDTPYRDIYEEEDFGWRRVAAKLDLIDVEGGHASMLQASHVSSLTAALAGRIG